MAARKRARRGGEPQRKRAGARPTHVSSLEALAKTLGIGKRTLIRHRMKHDGFPEQEAEGYSVGATAEWLLALVDGGVGARGAREESVLQSSKRRRRRAPLVAAAGGAEELARIAPDLEIETARYRKAKREQEELKLAQMRLELVPAAELEDALAARLVEFQQMLKTAARKIGARGAAVSDRRRLQRLALEELDKALAPYRRAPAEEVPA